MWRGRGLLSIIRSPWCVVAVGARYEWAVTYFALSNVGTAPGVDVYARTPSLIPQRVREILAQVRADPFMARASEGMFATVQKGVTPEHYRLDTQAEESARGPAGDGTHTLSSSDSTH